MINLLANLVNRTLDRTPVLKRRQPTLFEPVKDAAPLTARHDDVSERMSEDEFFAKPDAAIDQNPRTDITNAQTQVVSPAQQRPHTASQTPGPLEVTSSEGKTQLVPPRINSISSITDFQEDSVVREKSLPHGETDRHHLNHAAAPVYEPTIETIVERKFEREVVFQDDRHQPHLEETNLVEQLPDNSPQSNANHVRGRRQEARRTSSIKVDSPALNKPAAQRRATEQEMRRGERARLQSESAEGGHQPTPTINVTIGRVEVRATAAPKRVESARPAGPKLSLEDYLRGRKGN